MKRILIFIGAFFLLVFFVVLFALNGQPLTELEQQEGTRDTRPPSTAIYSPQERSWHNTGFLVTFLDSDLDSNLAEVRECEYLIYNLQTERVFGGTRPCGYAEVFVPVGEEEVCSDGLCQVSSKARDAAGNESSFKSRIYRIDTAVPAVGETSLPSIVLPEQKLVVEAVVSDNGKVAGCGFFAGNEQAVTPELSPLPCEKGEQCMISLTHAFSVPGEYTGFFACRDAAGNVGVGKEAQFRVFVNKPPEISLCRVMPTRGSTGAELGFEVQAKDSDQDPLSFVWDFGDGSVSQEQSPFHAYLQPGTYQPKVEVQDPSGEIASCNTAWAVVY